MINAKDMRLCDFNLIKDLSFKRGNRTNNYSSVYLVENLEKEVLYILKTIKRNLLKNFEVK